MKTDSTTLTQTEALNQTNEDEDHDESLDSSRFNSMISEEFEDPSKYFFPPTNATYDSPTSGRKSGNSELIEEQPMQ